MVQNKWQIERYRHIACRYSIIQDIGPVGLCVHFHFWKIMTLSMLEEQNKIYQTTMSPYRTGIAGARR